MLASVFDRTLGHFMTGCWQGAPGLADVAAHRGDRVCPDAGVLRPVMNKLTRPVIAGTLLEVTERWGPTSGRGTMLHPVIY